MNEQINADIKIKPINAQKLLSNMEPKHIGD